MQPSPIKVSAAIPCRNGGAAVPQSLARLRAQTYLIDEMFVLDDGSTDQSCADLSVSVIRFPENRGRGAARAEMVRRATGLFLLSCDTTIEAPADFLERAMRWMADEKVAAVFGQLRQTQPRTAADRWWGRHVFRLDLRDPLCRNRSEVNRYASLATGCCLLRLSAVRAVGNFDESLREREDLELGQRLIDAGFFVVFDPELLCLETRWNTLGGVLPRYRRWNIREDRPMTLREYRGWGGYAYKTMLPKDLRERDMPAALITLLLPHFLFWRSARWRRGRC